MVYLMIVLFGTLFSSVAKDLKESIVGNGNSLLNDKMLEVDFSENYADFYELYDFRDTTSVKFGTVCGKNANLQDPKLVYDQSTKRFYLLINPWVQLRLSGICENHSNSMWSIPIKSSTRDNIHHYPYFYDNIFVDGTECRKIFYIGNDMLEHDLRACVNISVNNTMLSMSFSGTSVENIFNNINKFSSNETQRPFNILCNYMGQDSLFNPFTLKITSIKGNETINITTTNTLIGSYKTECSWYGI